MIRGAYTAIAELVAAQRRMELVADAVANVSTVGFKQELATQSAYEWLSGIVYGDGSPVAELGQLGTGTYAVGTKIDRSQGALQQTGLLSDLAIAGDGLFVVGTDGGPAYTRAGDFHFDPDGVLRTQNGLPVLATDGRPVVVPGGDAAFQVGPDGTIVGTGQRLALVAFPEAGITRLGENLYAIPSPTALADGAGRVIQGTLESSNVDMSGAMTDLIALQRGFQLASRALSLQDQSLADATAIARLRG